MEPTHLSGSSNVSVFRASVRKHTVSYTMQFDESIWNLHEKDPRNEAYVDLENIASPHFSAEDDGEVFFKIYLSRLPSTDARVESASKAVYQIHLDLVSKPLPITVHFSSRYQPDLEGPFLCKEEGSSYNITVHPGKEKGPSIFKTRVVESGHKGFRMDTTYLKVTHEIEQSNQIKSCDEVRPINCLGTDLLTNSSFSDITLKSNEREWKLHKNVLSARSKVFAAMFASDMKENKDGVVEFKDVDSTALDLMIKFIYSDSIDLHDIHQDTAMELLDLGEQYDLPILKKLCERRLISHLSAKNCLRLCAFAGKHNCQLLLTPAKRMLADNLANICKSQKDELADFVRGFGDLSVAVFDLNHLKGLKQM